MIRTTSLVLVDDQPGFVAALTLHLATDPDLRLVGTAATAPDAVDLLHRLSCDVVVMDHRLFAELPGRSHAGTVTSIRALPATLPIVLLVDGSTAADMDSSADGEDLLDAIAAGVSGWVDRSAGPDAVITAVRDVSRGESHLPTEQVQALLASRRERQHRTFAPGQCRELTERETAVLQGLAAGLSRAEIGVALQLSPNTVRTHVRSILRKYHVHSAPDVVALMTGKDRTDG